jgi:hypothetical protein
MKKAMHKAGVLSSPVDYAALQFSSYLFEKLALVQISHASGYVTSQFDERVAPFESERAVFEQISQ